TIHVRPTPCEDDTGPVARSGFVGLERVAHNRAFVAADERLERGGTFVVPDPVADNAWGGDAPHLPWLRPVRFQLRPAPLIKSDDWLLDRVREQSDFRRRESMSERRELIPKCLRRHLDAVPAKDPFLPCERDVIEILVERNLDHESKRVASAACRALRTRRCLDAATAATDVFLLFDLHDAIADLDEVDQLRLFELPGHRVKRATAARTGAVRSIELENSIQM